MLPAGIGATAVSASCPFISYFVMWTEPNWYGKNYPLEEP